jgi:hypothetical protein
MSLPLDHRTLFWPTHPYYDFKIRAFTAADDDEVTAAVRVLLDSALSEAHEEIAALKEEIASLEAKK